MNISDKQFKIVVLAAVIVCSFSDLYYFVVRLFQEEQPYRECLQEAESVRGIRYEVYEKQKERLGVVEAFKLSNNPININAEYKVMREKCFEVFKR